MQYLFLNFNTTFTLGVALQAPQMYGCFQPPELHQPQRHSVPANVCLFVSVHRPTHLRLAIAAYDLLTLLPVI